MQVSGFSFCGCLLQLSSVFSQDISGSVAGLQENFRRVELVCCLVVLGIWKGKKYSQSLQFEAHESNASPDMGFSRPSKRYSRSSSCFYTTHRCCSVCRVIVGPFTEPFVRICHVVLVCRGFLSCASTTKSVFGTCQQPSSNSNCSRAFRCIVCVLSSSRSHEPMQRQWHKRRNKRVSIAG